MIDNAINPDPAKEGKGKKYSDKGLKEHASYGSTWNSVYKHHRKEGTVPNDPLFDFMRVRGWTAGCRYCFEHMSRLAG